MSEYFARQIPPAPATAFTRDMGATTDSALLPLSDAAAYLVVQDRHGARMAFTSDGGDTIDTVAPIPRPIARTGFTATFVSRDTGYLVTRNDGTLDRTTDGAWNWDQVRQPS